MFAVCVGDAVRELLADFELGGGGYQAVGEERRGDGGQS